MLLDFFKRERGRTHVLAIDLGTASISAAAAVRHEGEKTEILKVLRYPIDLFGYQLGGVAEKLPYILKDGFIKVFKDAFGVLRHFDIIMIGFADPFCVDKTTERKITRANSSSAITEEEINRMVKSLRDEIMDKMLAIVGHEILSMRVNGYEVDSANRYKGKSLEAAIMFTSISPTLKEYVESAKEMFFPKSGVFYYSDAAVFRKALKSTGNLYEHGIAMDIGGEMTTIFDADACVNQRYGAAAFGVRTLMRRVEASMKIDAAEAESLIKKYSSGALDEAIKTKVEKVLTPALSDWFLALQEPIRQFASGNYTRKIMLTGGGADLALFAGFLKESLKRDYNIAADIQIFNAEIFRDFFAGASQNWLRGGGDVILSSLALLTP
ncbi:hypothetical protein A2926_03735 [Candidatus Giovannonibacteria bacterium RIFCSPLOWO2_01_FULL_44_40]|uniref:SHS2 domain-containing protein n=1 Tax=Candidatus Giovannonibacteria bacterium RIFCSPHIGHO2_01_FULL_45_23 TaxID=1798325 RepID=A0A1F5VIE1_9BACT|nr:MAG: hypothetical protein A2834_03810 [Candidatus Giovannonibacteria bacterium RIFCSPHIGHO2_01_FULL_45_23]OGF75825.1 MAG: hypothetical protein A3C77_04560 [Candidatus Giovannonibacteria bacterium RIFCSPHIGHO2_02_FULL_45_13]OGF80246.1 MAG: hypothetical protein A2926_03735 [Candidatus Giovannonibacteria bacterium RIFCSPLOWO2_01_FULL_44_40]